MEVMEEVVMVEAKDMVGSPTSYTSTWRLKSSSINMDVENVATPSPTIRTHHIICWENLSLWKKYHRIVLRNWIQNNNNS